MTKRVTLKMIAERVGYSKNTVSLALRGDPQIPPRTRDRIRKAAQEMGYQRNPIVAHLMAELRSFRESTGFQAKLALFNAGLEPNVTKARLGFAAHVEGCRERANQLGYSFDEFWLHDPSVSAACLIRILTTRGIKGIVIVGLSDHYRLPGRFRSVWNRFPTAVIGVRTRDPALPFACVDYHNLMVTAQEKVLKLGYRRPALVIDDELDRLVERRYSAGALAVQKEMGEDQKVPPFIEAHLNDNSRWSFYEWIGRNKPDVVLTPHAEVAGWLEDRGLSIPEKVGMVQLDLQCNQRGLAGMDQQRKTTGMSAVDLVINQIHHNGKGVPVFPVATLIGATWTNGSSVIDRSHESEKISTTANLQATN